MELAAQEHAEHEAEAHDINNPLLNEMPAEERERLESLVAADPASLSMEDMHSRVVYMVKERAAAEERARMEKLCVKEPTIEEIIALEQAMAAAMEEARAEAVQMQLQAEAEAAEAAAAADKTRKLDYIPDGVELTGQLAQQITHEGFYNEEVEAGGDKAGQGGAAAHTATEVTSVREQLKHLSTYVSGHTNRKILSSWNHVEARFQQSPLFYVEQRTLDDGRTKQIKHRALKLSDLSIVLCSTKVRVNHKELVNMYTTMGIAKGLQYLARRIAALRIVSQLMMGSKNKIKRKVDVELQVLMRESEPMTSIHELKDLVFPNIKGELDTWMVRIAEDKTKIVQDMLWEQKKRQEMIERAEQRMKKATADYSRALNEIQFSKGPLSIKRHAGLRSVLEYCKDAITDAQREEEVLIPKDIVNLLGEDVFPAYVNVSAIGGGAAKKAAPAIKRSDAHSKVLPLRFGGYGYFRLLLGKHGGEGYNALSNLKTVASYGRGLNGYSFRDVVEMLQAYSITRLQAFYRGYERRHRYDFAKKVWRRVYMLVKVTHFGAWRRYTQYFNSIRRRCFRKIKAWQFHVKATKRRKAVFTTCFWPFFVWRRYVTEECTAREKAKFLTSRVLPTYILLRNFRAWKRFHQKKYGDLRKADDFVTSQLHQSGVKFFRYLQRFANRRKGLRRSWLKEGSLLEAKKLNQAKNTQFAIWRSYVYYMTAVKELVQREAPAFAREALGKRQNRPPRKFSKNGERRAKGQLILAQEAAELAALPVVKEKTKAELDAEKKEEKERVRRMGKIERLKYERALKEEDEKRKKKEAEAIMESMDLSVTEEFVWQLPHVKFHIPERADNENGVDIPRVLEEVYSEAVTDDLLDPNDMEFLQFADAWTRGRCDVLRLRFRQIARLELLETGFRWHRLAHTALAHLRVFAHVSRNARSSQKTKRLEALLKSFTGLVMWANRGDVSAAISMDAGSQSEAEKLRNDLRIARLDKLRRRRVVNKEMKDRGLPKSPRTPLTKAEKMQLRKDAVEAEERAEREAEAAAEAEVKEKMAAQFGKPKGPKSPKGGAGGKTAAVLAAEAEVQAIEAELQAQKDEATRVKREAQDALAATYEAPNIFHWDQEDRARDDANAQKIAELSTRFTEEAVTIVQAADEESGHVWALEDLKAHGRAAVHADEAAVTEAAMDGEMEYADKFKLHAARLMLDTLSKINHEVKQLLMRRAVKGYFRMLRLPRLEAVSKIMLNRKRLQNWIRLCRRLASVYDKMPFYRKRRQMWIIFNRWLKLIEMNRIGCSHGLVNELKTRRAGFLSYDHYLSHDVYPAIVKTVYFMNCRIQYEVGTREACFYRWKSFSVENYFFRKLFICAIRWRRLKVLEKCFWVMKRIGTRGILGALIKRYPSRMLQRCECDFDQITKRFCALRKKTVHYVTGKWNRKFIFKYKQDALHEQTFKQFMVRLMEGGKTRALSEQRMLVTAFEARGSLQCVDVRAPASPDKKGISLSMQRADGVRVADPPLEDTWKDTLGTSIPAGFRLTKIRIVSQHSYGIVGWQMQWGADSMPNRSGKRRGKWLGGQLNFEEIDIPQNDFVVGIDYTYEGSTTIALRLRLLTHGLTKWYGLKTSRSVLTMSLSAKNDSPVLPFEENFRSAGRDELEKPAYPRNYVIGLACHDNGVRITNFQLVTRKVDTQDVFSYTWVDDGVRRLEERLAKEAALAAEIAEEARLEKLAAMMEAGGVAMPSVDDSLPAIAPVVVEESDSEDELDAPADNETEDDVVISRHEEEFFDVIRMRNGEVSEAQRRAEQLARRIWRSYELRDPGHPMAPLTTVRVVSAICFWLFSTVSKRLSAYPVHEKRAVALLQEGRIKALQSEVFDRRAFGLREMAENLAVAQYPWTGMKLVPPALKKQKMAMLDQIKTFKSDSKLFVKTAEDMRINSDELQLEGRLLMPRLQLSIYVTANYRIKVEAARHKASLLEQMDLRTMKNALCGGAAEGGLSEDEMSLLRQSMLHTDVFSASKTNLGYITDHAVNYDRARTADRNKLHMREEKKKQQLLTTMRTGGNMADRERMKHSEGTKTARNIRCIDPPGQVLPKSASVEALSITRKKNHILASSRVLHSRSSLLLSRGSEAVSTPEGTLASLSQHNLVQVGPNYFIDIPFNSEGGGSGLLGEGGDSSVGVVGDITGNLRLKSAGDMRAISAGGGLEALDGTNQDQ